MYQGTTTIGIITARGGSKGVPKKNIRPLGGRPLIAWTIEAAKRSVLLDEVIVSTDDDEIAAVALRCGARVPFRRPAELASDTAKHIPVLQHALAWLRDQEGKTFNYCMNLQPTSPFRTAEDIDACIRKIVDTRADSVMSMKEIADFSLPKLKVLDGDRILPFVEEEGSASVPRRELRTVYKRNCAIYLTRSDLIMAGDLFGTDSRAYVMPEDRSLDINTPFDFELAEFLANRIRISESVRMSEFGNSV